MLHRTSKMVNQKCTLHSTTQFYSESFSYSYYSKGDAWPSRVIMQLMPKQLIGSIGGQYLKDSKTVVFHPAACESLENLTKMMSSGFVCLFENSVDRLRIIIIKYDLNVIGWMRSFLSAEPFMRNPSLDFIIHCREESIPGIRSEQSAWFR